jgi:hypothetical protein
VKENSTRGATQHLCGCAAPSLYYAAQSGYSPPIVICFHGGKTMGNYSLYVKVADQWVRRFQILANNHTEAFRDAMMQMSRDDYQRQIRMEQDDELSGDCVPVDRSQR